MDTTATITFTLNYQWSFQQIAIGGYTGNTAWDAGDNIKGASIQTSTDNTTWETVGTIPSTFADGKDTVTLTKKVTAKYIRFTRSTSLGIGYLTITKST